MSSGKEGGFTYLGALILVAALGFGLASIGQTWSHARQREKEAELRWIGSQFKQAIGLYYHRTPGPVPRYPQTLQDLVEDKRFPNPQRYLRRIYTDPMTGKPEWQIVSAPGGGIMGVHSLSSGRPIKLEDGAASYSDWRFIYEPPSSPGRSPRS